MISRKINPVFSDKHREYIRAASQATIAVAEGAVRAGKTIDNIAAFAYWIEHGTPGRIHLATGSTAANAKLNIGDANGFGLEYIFRGRCRWTKFKGNEALVIRAHRREYVVIFAGAAKADSFKKIRGNSYEMWIATEINLHHENSIREAFNRQLAAQNRHVFWDLNPSAPGHWIYENYIDRFSEQFGERYVYEHFTIRDNAAISEERFREIEAQYTPGTVWYSRDILGRRCAAEGLIYPMYADAIAEVPPGEAEAWCMSIDYGTQNPFAAILWEKHGDVWYAGNGYYYDGRANRAQKTDEDYGAAVDELAQVALSKMETPTNIYGIREKLRVIVDPSAASFIALLRRREWCKCIPADNDVADGIRETATAMQNGLIKISPKLKEWRKEAEGYVWDEDADDKPVKERDHYLDSTRYFVRTMHITKPKSKYNPLWN